MIVYSFTLLFTIFLVIRYDINQQKEGKNEFFLIELLIFILIVGLQWRMGEDNLSYETSYDNIPELHDYLTGEWILGTKYQPFWILFTSFLRTITKSFVFFHLIHSIIVNTLIFIYIRKHTRYVFSVILLYFISFNYFYFNIEIQRESMALVFFLMSLDYLVKKKYVIYYIFAVVCFLFHISSLFMFVLPFLLYLFSKMNTTRKFLVGFSLVMIGVTMVGSFLQNSIIVVGMEAADNISGFAEHYGEIEQNRTNIMIASLFQMFPLALALFVGKNRLPKDILYYSCILVIVFYWGNVYLTGFYRLVNYFIIPLYIYLVNLTYDKIIISRNKRLICIIYLFMAINTANYYIHPSPMQAKWGGMAYNMYIPYRSIFD